LVENGAKEINLLGQNVNAYNFEKKKLSDLIFEISEIKELERIRYTTSHPKDFSDDLILAHKNCKKLMPLIHLPVQSGSNNILEAMNRKHTIEDYLNIIKKLNSVRSDIKFSSDFIIGYPGETHDDYKKTIELMTKVGFVNSYSFTFSARPGTPAFNLEQIDLNVAKNRLIEFKKIAEDIKNSYRKTLIGKIAKVLFENKMKSGNRYFGRDEHFNSVIVESNDDLTGQIKNVKILEGNQNTLFGEIASKLNQTNYAA
jgi:tRNA-2-methylthio-N6-dimethylallyladenosine synthase